MDAHSRLNNYDTCVSVCVDMTHVQLLPVKSICATQLKHNREDQAKEEVRLKVEIEVKNSI